MFLNKIFSKEKINYGRQIEIDLLRGFTVIILIICHVGLFLDTSSTSTMHYFCDIIGSEPAAPVFMMLMGMSMVYGRIHTPGHYLRKGIKYLLLGALLNLIRSFPYWFLGSIDYFACIEGFFVDDIFIFVGFAFLLISLFKLFKSPAWVTFIVSIVFLIVGQILLAIPNCLNFPKELTYFLNFFLPLNNDWCCFNLLTWFIYPCIGLVFGELLIRCKNKNYFYLILLVLGIAGITILYVNIFTRFPNYTSYYFGNNFYRMGILNTLVTIMCFCFFISFWYFISKILPGLIKKFLTFLSRNISFLFFFSWVEISILIHVQAYNFIVFSVIALIGIMLGVFITTCLCVIPYNKIKNILKQKLISVGFIK